MRTSEPKLRQLTIEDLPAAMELKELAGWNQTEEDWRLFLDLTPAGSFGLESRGRLIGTSTAMPYPESFGWIGMMLVHPAERQRGHGRRMLAEAVSYLEGRGLTVALDATPLGRKLYFGFGFEDVYEIERWVGESGGGHPRDPNVFAVGAEGIGQAFELDRESFGTDRSAVLLGFLRRHGALAWIYRGASEVGGYLIGRRGSDFLYLGPWVARTPEAAGALWRTALAELGRVRVGLDLPVLNRAVRRLARDAGLKRTRRLVRMVRVSHQGLYRELAVGGRPHRIYGLAGLEWG